MSQSEMSLRFRTYITNYNNARALIRKVDRDDLLQAMLRSYLNV